MIKVIRLNGEILYLNLFQIEYMESIPETKIKMMNVNYQESANYNSNQCCYVHVTMPPVPTALL